jgi:hypothetical protein
MHENNACGNNAGFTVTGEWRKLHSEKLHNLYSSPNIIGQITSRRRGGWGYHNLIHSVFAWYGLCMGGNLSLYEECFVTCLKCLMTLHDDMQNTMDSVRFQVLTAASMKLRVFWDVTPCSHEVDRRFTVHTSETLFHFNVTIQCYIPEDSKHHGFCSVVALKVAMFSGVHTLLSLLDALSSVQNWFLQVLNPCLHGISSHYWIIRLTLKWKFLRKQPM